LKPHDLVRIANSINLNHFGGDLMRDHNSSSTQSSPESSSRSIPKGILAGFAAVILAAGGGVAWWTWQSQTPKATLPGADLPAPAPSDMTQVPVQQTVQVYWLKTVGDQIEISPAPVAVAVAGQPDALLKAAFEEMLKGSPESADLTSTIPVGTTLRQVAMKPDGVHVDLSQAFTSGGGSTSMIGRLGQVVYTATTLDPNATVWISVEGKPLEVLGGEGLMVDQPMTRSTFEQNFKP
jgi:spore germination protein GerM